MTSVTIAPMLVEGILCYVDPGSGSYFFQILIAGFSATALLWREVSQRLATRMKRPKNQPAKDAEEHASKD